MEFDTIRTAKQKTKSIPGKISILDTSKLSFRICIKNTLMPGEGGQNASDTIYIETSIIRLIKTFDTISNTSMYAQPEQPLQPVQLTCVCGSCFFRLLAWASFDKMLIWYSTLCITPHCIFITRSFPRIFPRSFPGGRGRGYLVNCLPGTWYIFFSRKFPRGWG